MDDNCLDGEGTNCICLGSVQVGQLMVATTSTSYPPSRPDRRHVYHSASVSRRPSVVQQCFTRANVPLSCPYCPRREVFTSQFTHWPRVFLSDLNIFCSVSPPVAGAQWQCLWRPKSIEGSSSNCLSLGVTVFLDATSQCYCVSCVLVFLLALLLSSRLAKPPRPSCILIIKSKVPNKFPCSLSIIINSHFVIVGLTSNDVWRK